MDAFIDKIRIITLMLLRFANLWLLVRSIWILCIVEINILLTSFLYTFILREVVILHVIMWYSVIFLREPVNLLLQLCLLGLEHFNFLEAINQILHLSLVGAIAVKILSQVGLIFSMCLLGQRYKRFRINLRLHNSLLILLNLTLRSLNFIFG